MLDLITKRIQESISVKEQLIKNTGILDTIEEISSCIVSSLNNKGKVIFAGNGGSFSDSFHLSGEFTSRFMFDRPALASIVLGANNSSLSAIGNDYSYDNIFSRELSALGKKGDVFIAISTSGNSPNILKAIKVAKEKGINVFGLTGLSGGVMKDECKCVCVPSDVTARIQESHIVIGHIICEIIESQIFNEEVVK